MRWICWIIRTIEGVDRGRVPVCSFSFSSSNLLITCVQGRATRRQVVTRGFTMYQVSHSYFRTFYSCAERKKADCCHFIVW